MAQEYLLAGDTIAGTEGRLTAIIRGNIETLLHIRKIEAKIEKNKEDMKVIGFRGKQTKAVGFTGSGEMEAYIGNPLFTEIMEQYTRNGIDTYFNILISTHDKTSQVGEQSVLLLGVNLDETIISKLDAEESMLTETIPFTFNDFQLTKKFNRLNY